MNSTLIYVRTGRRVNLTNVVRLCMGVSGVE